jgi:hypothetical protein
VSTQTVDLPEAFAQNERDIAEAWLKFTIEHFQANIKRLRIGVTHELEQSFVGTLVSLAGGDELKLRIAYAIQGMYTDMGVGRGMGAGVTKASGQTKEGRDYNELRNSRGQLHRHQRRAKRWYSKQMAFDRRRLAELVSDLWGKTMIAQVDTVVPEQAVQVSF